MTIFALEIDGQPGLVFDAASIEEANGICTLPEFRADLGGLTSAGAPVCGEGAVFLVREAAANEIASFNRARLRAEPAEGPTFVFLIPVDGMVVTVVAPDH